jgi:adenylosuccinate lyase
MARQDAYIVVQRSAMLAWQGQGRFRDRLAEDPEVASRLSRPEIDELFDMERALAYVPDILGRALGSA